MDRKKIVIVIVIVVGALALGVGVYFAWKNSQAILNPPEGGSLPLVGDQKFGTITRDGKQNGAAKLKILSRNAVFDYWLFSPSLTAPPEIFYLGIDGKIYKIPGSALSIGGRGNGDEVVSGEPFFDLQSVKATADGKIVLVKTGVLTNPRFTLFNTETKVKQELGNISAAAFSPDGKKFAYLEAVAGGGPMNLMTRDLGEKFSLGRPAKIISISAKDFDLEWVQSDKILLTPKPSSEYESQIWSVNLKNKTINSLATGRGLMIDWSLDGKLAVVSKSGAAGRTVTSYLADQTGKLLANLDLNILPAKCLVADPQAYCALPQSYNTPQEPNLPDDYLKRAVYTRDFIYMLDTQKNSLEPVFAALDPMIDAIRLSKIQSHLFFVNRYDNKLYSLSL